MSAYSFTSPDPIFRGTDFWMLNDALQDEEIVFQIKKMHEQGVYSFIARTYIGLKSDYPGENFKHSMHVIVDTAKSYGMKVFLQAGYMPEAVPDLDDACALRYIYPVKEGEEDGRRVFCRHEGTVFVEHDSRTFLNMFDKKAVEHYLYKCYEEMWADFADEYGKTILSVWVDEPSYNGFYLPFTPDLDELFSARYGYALSQQIWKLFFDAPDAATVRYHYRALLQELLEVNYFATVRDWCHAHGLWFSGHLMMEERLTSQICRAGAVMPFYKYFDMPGIDVLRASMNWKDAPVKTPDETELRWDLYLTTLQCVSAAHQAGKEQILAEMYGVSSENWTFRNQLYMFDEYAAMGINHRCVHGMFYSLGGRGKRAYPPHVHYYQPYFEKYADVTDYVARVGTFISRGKAMSDTLIVHPLETGFTLYRGSLDGKTAIVSEEAKAYDMKLYRLVRLLKSTHLDPELGDQPTLASSMTAVTDDGILRVGEMSYGTVILPYLAVLTAKVLCLLEDFAAHGGKVIVLGCYPTLLDGTPDESLARRLEKISVFAATDADAAALLRESFDAYRLEGRGIANLFVNRRADKNGENYFLVNNDCLQNAAFTLAVKGKRKALMHNAFDGSARACPASYDAFTDETSVSLSIPFGASVCLSLDHAPTASFEEQEAPVSRAVTPLDGGWTVEPEGDNTLLLEYARYKKGDGAFSDPLPVMAIHALLTQADYHGEVTLDYTIRASERIGGLTLAAEKPERMAISLNGVRQPNVPEGYFFAKEFETVKLASPLEKGENHLTVTCFFEPLSKATKAINSLFETQRGVELEPMYLNGRFLVRAEEQATRNGCTVLENRFTLSPMPETVVMRGDLRADGFPFYTGILRLVKTIHRKKANDDVFLSVGVMNAAVCEVFVNGRSFGDVYRAPMRVPVSLNEGENRVELVLYGTLHSIIGPFHRPRGDIGNVFGGGYANPNYAWLSLNIEKEGWEKRMNDAYPWWTDAYNLTPFGVNDVQTEEIIE